MQQQKSRAFYRIQATRMMIGAGNILKKHAADQARKVRCSFTLLSPSDLAFKAVNDDISSVCSFNVLGGEQPRDSGSGRRPSHHQVGVRTLFVPVLWKLRLSEFDRCQTWRRPWSHRQGALVLGTDEMVFVMETQWNKKTPEEKKHISRNFSLELIFPITRSHLQGNLRSLVFFSNWMLLWRRWDWRKAGKQKRKKPSSWFLSLGWACSSRKTPSPCTLQQIIDLSVNVGSNLCIGDSVWMRDPPCREHLLEGWCLHNLDFTYKCHHVARSLFRIHNARSRLNGLQRHFNILD